MRPSFVKRIWNMSQSEKKLIDECIQSHHNMIKRHRKAILELSRKLIKVPEICTECFDFEIINESGRSNKDSK